MKAKDVKVGQEVWVKVKRWVNAIYSNHCQFEGAISLHCDEDVYLDLLPLCERLRDELKAAQAFDTPGLPCDDDCDCDTCQVLEDAEAVLGPVDKEDK